MTKGLGGTDLGRTTQKDKEALISSCSFQVQSTIFQSLYENESRPIKKWRLPELKIEKSCRKKHYQQYRFSFQKFQDHKVFIFGFGGWTSLLFQLNIACCLAFAVELQKEIPPCDPLCLSHQLHFFCIFLFSHSSPTNKSWDGTVAAEELNETSKKFHTQM